MQRHDDLILKSASDLVNFLGCRHATVLDLRALDDPEPEAEDDEHEKLIKEKGERHERAALARFKSSLAVTEIPSGDLPDRIKATRDAIASGAEIVYQAALIRGGILGYADFLKRVSARGNEPPRFEVWDTKLARKPKPKHLIQLCVYSDLLGAAQGAPPRELHLLLGTGETASFRFADFRYYYRRALARFEDFCVAPPAESAPEPCAHCDHCRWRDKCGTQWEDEDHLSLVAGMQRGHEAALRAAGIGTVTKLAALPASRQVADINIDSLARLREQAQLQVHKRTTGCDKRVILPLVAERGFARLPPPDPGDLFFDMEGDPHHQPRGREYLFGVHGADKGRSWYRDFWGHDDAGERRAFETVMDFFADHLAKHPAAHVYHFGSYEVSTVKKLASWHATREYVLDDMLRGRRFVDLLRIVREAVRISEPAYSLKNIEVFYARTRGGAVRSGGDSIVAYERWRDTRDDALLREIRDYNEADCRSTAGARDWLLSLRPPDLPWREAGPAAEPESARSEQRKAHEARIATLRTALLDGATEPERAVRTLVGDLLDFHRRAARPGWWEYFDRQDCELDELIDDADCLGGLEADTKRQPEPVKRSLVYTLRFPPQVTKMKVGDGPHVAATSRSAGKIVELDADKGIIRLQKAGPELPVRMSLKPQGPLDDTIMRAAVERFARSLLKSKTPYAAIDQLLRRAPPRIEKLATGAPILPEGADVLKGAMDAARRLEDSYLFIQGPPGAGKTHTASHIIAALLRAGRRIGVSANSHKAISNLLRAVEERAAETKLRFRGVKRSKGDKPDTWFNGRTIEDVFTNDEVLAADADLVAGTAWLLAREELDRSLDYLFVDEAGQVSLANIVAMGTSARNIVLIGDQMQLGQPIQGVHPGESGFSVLEYLLEDAATIAPDRGIFLSTTYRMHEHICRFISEAVYDGRLEPEPSNQKQRLLLAAGCHRALRPTGIRFVPVEHSGCSQVSNEEQRVVARIYGDLLKQRFCNKEGRIKPMTPDNILVVAPYNAQVNRLASILPDSARVGTVDKFQGQEAEVVLISMTTSSGEDLPRDIEFLYSRNRLNVAISRARCLAVIVASPRLLETPCRTVEQMRLVNTLCWAADYAERSASAAVCSS